MENMHIAFSPPDITEEEIAEVVDTLRSGWITTGPKTKLFEKQLAEYIGTNRVVCLNSATACLEMTLRLLGIGPGDEVITTAYTYTASASVVEHVGAKLVLVDVAKDSYEIDYEKLGRKKFFYEKHAYRFLSSGYHGRGNSRGCRYVKKWLDHNRTKDEAF